MLHPARAYARRGLQHASMEPRALVALGALPDIDCFQSAKLGPRLRDLAAERGEVVEQFAVLGDELAITPAVKREAEEDWGGERRPLTD
jgi:hypothetical protein